MMLYLLFALPGLLLGMWASWRVSANFRRYSQVGTHRGLSGAEAAAEVLHAAGIHDVEIVNVPGTLTDHYDPSTKRLALSDATYASRSIAAVGVAAHEAGHAVQHAQGYKPMFLRQQLVGPATLGSNLFFWIIFAGGLIRSLALIQVGVILFSAVVLFQLVTLPVEFDATFRAKRLVVETGIVGRDEREGMDKVLNAAAWTYVAAAVASVSTLLYYLLQFGGGSSDD